MKRFLLPRVAGRIFGEPLAIDPKKLDVIVTAVGPRLRGMPFDGDDDPDDNDSGQSSGYQIISPGGVAVIDVCGTLVAKTSGMQAASGMTSYADIAANMTAALMDPNVSGIVFAIDSPGGEVDGMFDLADAIYSARGQKPMCAVVSCAASAAYMIASATDYVMLSQTGIVGSIGIICLHLDESAADEKAGLKYTAIYAGDRKNDGNPHEPLTPEARDSMQARVNTLYGMFAGAVARNRGMAESSVKNTQAAIYMGQDGVNIGLADALGSEADGLSLVARTAMSGAKSIYAASAAIPPKENAMHETALPNATADAKVPTPAEIDAMLAKARQEGFGDAAQIFDLCAIAGAPELAGAFVTEKKSAGDVRAALLARRVEDQKKTAINTSMMPGTDAAADPAAPVNKAKPWGEILATLGFKRK